jgi:hypothetical protein
MAFRDGVQGWRSGMAFRDEISLHTYNVTMYICYIATSIHHLGPNKGLHQRGFSSISQSSAGNFRPVDMFCQYL